MGESERTLECLYRERYVGFRNALAPIVGGREAARDVVQEAFAQALRDARQLRRQESAAAWVWMIAFRIAVRERARVGVVELPEDLAILHEDRDPFLVTALRTLSPRRRLVVFLRYYASFTYAEIAEALEIEEGTVAATLSQAHAALLTQIVEEEEVS